MTSANPDRIWFVTAGEPLPTDDPAPRLLRTGLFAQAFREAGWSVTWWTSTVDHFAKTQRASATRQVRTADGIRIVELHGTLYRRNVSLARLVNHAQLGREFRRHVLAETQSPRVIVASYPTIELAYESAVWARTRGIPMIVDVRDLWPDALVDLVPRFAAPLGWLALQPLFRKASAALRAASAIWGVSQRYLDFGLRHAGRGQGEHDCVVHLAAEGLPATASPDDRARQLLKSAGVDDGKLVCWFAGSFSITYDLSTVIRAARSLHSAAMHDVQFVFSGAGELDRQWAREASGLPNVVFTGWLDAAGIRAMSGMAGIGLQAYAPGAPQGLANKLVDYLRAGLPVLGSLPGENAEFLRKHACGESYPAGDDRALADAIIRLRDSRERRQAMSDSARRTFDSTFRADRVLGQAQEHVERLLAARRPAH